MKNEELRMLRALAARLGSKESKKNEELKQPRGLRNNNPLNIRFSEYNEWLGRVEKDKSDNSFEEFISLYFGIRAGIILLRRYIERGINTPRLIIRHWAPSNENNTEKYIENVCEWSGLERDEHLYWERCDDMIPLICAMIRMECGVDGPEWKTRVAASYVTYITSVRPSLQHASKYEFIISAIDVLNSLKKR